MAKWKPGPGWTKTKGVWRPDWRTNADFRVASGVAGVFKVAAWLTIGAGAVAVEAALESFRHSGTDHSTVVAEIIGIVFATALVASAFAFFAFVLELLVTIHYDLRLEESQKAASELTDQHASSSVESAA